MSYFIRILCRSDSRLTVGFIADFLEDGVYFEPFPRIEAEPSSDPKSVFEQVEVHYDDEKRPLIFTSAVGNEITQELAELVEFAEDSGVSEQLQQRIASSRQIVAIEVDQENLTEDAWGFCDCIEAAIAAKLDGIVFAPDDAVYDMNLQVIERL